MGRQLLMQLNSIGQDFSSVVRLDILPGIYLKRGIYQTNIQYVTDTGGCLTMHHMSQNMHGGTNEELIYNFGCDVREFTFEIYCHNSFPTSPLLHIKYSMRVDRLILLNLAAKLLNKVI